MWRSQFLADVLYRSSAESLRCFALDGAACESKDNRKLCEKSKFGEKNGVPCRPKDFKQGWSMSSNWWVEKANKLLGGDSRLDTNSSSREEVLKKLKAEAKKAEADARQKATAAEKKVLSEIRGVRVGVIQDLIRRDLIKIGDKILVTSERAEEIDSELRKQYPRTGFSSEIFVDLKSGKLKRSREIDEELLKKIKNLPEGDAFSRILALLGEKIENFVPYAKSMVIRALPPSRSPFE